MLLWTLDVLARTDAEKKPVRRLTARFKRFVTVGEAAALTVTKRTETSVWLDLAVAGLTSAQIAVDFGAPSPCGRRRQARRCPLRPRRMI